MNTKIIAIAWAVILTQLAGCSRVDVTLEKPTPPLVVQNASAPAAQRIVEIDRILSKPLTGLPEDADQRATLRAERAALANPFAQTVATTRPVQPVAPRQHTSVAINREPQAKYEPYRLPALEAMTPSERERYYKDLRIRNSYPIVPIYSR